jgi:hypothetical protein
MKDSTEATRARLGGLREDISSEAASGYESAKSAAASVMAVARENSLPLCLIGAGLAWIMLSMSQKESKSARRRAYSHYLSTGEHNICF